jgi:MGT family glycosyltransferase
MARILVTAMPFAGHVAPITGVVAHLVARGHDVAVYTGSRYASRFEALGARPIRWAAAPDFDERDLRATFAGVGRRGPLGVLANLEHVFIRTGEGQARDLLAAHAITPFDVIAGDVMSVGAGMAAELAGVPWATLSIVPLSMPSRDLPPSGLALHPGHGPLGRLRDGMLRGVVRAATRPLDRALRHVRGALGLPAGEPFERALYSSELVVATGSPLLEYPRSDLGSQFEFVGRLVPADPAIAAVAPSWRDDLRDPGRRVVLVTQGTFNTDPADLLRPALSALAYRDVLVLGTTSGARIPGPVPANARLADRLDFGDVLPHVDLMITNGGWGGVLEALSNGIPLIVAGGDLDKPEIAARVAWSGAGVDLRSGRPSARAVLRAYERVSADASFAAAADRIGQDLGALGGAGRAADLIAELAR